ncbi:peptide/nickel transport system permease protein [Streptomyces sp. DvalAA-14]|uniref:ABC transporter permease n=1 Tax=unclassified Streptomyces TaxID=2593676 RepID=UPI00081BA13F|nr:ABC transporter permease [Streptomyces sp. DvalAA-14]MYS21086.1 ABC transporter permease subunit [Streptomyces sp. SID4948]SCD83851.1 peptide/nickel transport system permease protein [Streptomyces sp. DvalAA-14]
MRTLLRKVAFYLLTAWAAISLNFLIPRIMPGNPADNLINQFHGKLSPAAVHALRVLFGQSNQNLWQQYVSYWHSVFTGNFGISYAYYPSKVSTVLGQSMYWTLILVTLCTVLGFVIGTGLGMLAGWKRGSWLDSTLVPITTFLSSIPYFWFAIIIVYVFAITLKWFPLSGGYAIDQTIGFNSGFIGSAINYALLPAATITVASIGGWLIGMRNMMVTTLSEDYVRLAEAKGLSKRRVMYTYAARNAMLPSLSGFAMSLGFVVGGSIVTEVVFNYPGIGSVLFKAAQAADYPLMSAIFLLITVLVLIANLVADIAYVFLDPRTRES